MSLENTLTLSALTLVLLTGGANAADRSTPKRSQTMTQDTVRKNLDQSEIIATVNTIARGADAHDWTAVRGAFADAVELDYGTPETLKADVIIQRWQPLLEAFDVTQHLVTNHRVEVQGDKARSTSEFVATHFLKGAKGGELWTLTGTYEHELVRAGTSWKVTKMRMIPKLSTGNTGLIEEAKLRGPSPEAARKAQLEEALLREQNRKTVQEFLGTLERKDLPGFLALWSEDGVQEMPFAPKGFPTRLEGKAAIARQYGGLPKNFTYMRFPGLVIHPTQDPNVFFAEYRGDIELAGSGGRKYDNTYVGMFRLEKGKVKLFREYFNPNVLTEAFGASLQSNFNTPGR